MWIVQLALRRPYTFVIMSMLIVILGVLAILRMPTDIFPEIDIPVVSVIWSYSGITPEEMAEAITVRSERGFTGSVNDIEHIESQSLPGLGVIKVFFHPRAKIEAAVAQLNAASNSSLHNLPVGATPPNILRYKASSVPILQMSISSDSLPEQQIYDLDSTCSRLSGGSFRPASWPQFPSQETLPKGSSFARVTLFVSKLVRNAVDGLAGCDSQPGKTSRVFQVQRVNLNPFDCGDFRGSGEPCASHSYLAHKLPA